MKPKILAFLQCRYVYDAQRDMEQCARLARHLEQNYKDHANAKERGYWEARRRWNASLVVERHKNATGVRLKNMVHDVNVPGFSVDDIIWENATPRVGERSSDNFGFDAAHMANCINYWKPFIVILFGSVAQAGFPAAVQSNFGPFESIYSLIETPHPVARGLDGSAYDRLVFKLRNLLEDYSQKAQETIDMRRELQNKSI